MGARIAKAIKTPAGVVVAQDCNPRLRAAYAISVNFMPINTGSWNSWNSFPPLGIADADGRLLRMRLQPGNQVGEGTEIEEGFAKLFETVGR